MSAFNPPNPYFPTIDFNKSFFSIQGNFITLAYATKTYLNKITGGIISGLVSIIYSSSTPQLLIQNTNVLGTSSLSATNVSSTRSLNAGVGNSGALNFYYQNNGFIEAGTGANLVLNANGNASAPHLFISSTGNIGIGNNNPSCKLSFGTSTGLKILALYDASNDYQYVGFGANSGLCLNTAGTGDSFQFRVGTSSSSANEVMRITGTGNVGIGTNNTAGKLDVRGRAYSEGYSVCDAISYTNQFQLLIDPPTASTGATIQTVKQNVGFDQNLLLQSQGSGYVIMGGSLTTGIRIAGWDETNSIYQQTKNLGIRLGDLSKTISLGYFGGNSSIITINNTSVAISQPTTVSGNVGIGVAPNTDALNINGTVNTLHFKTTMYSQMLLKSISISPVGATGGPYGNGYWLINIYDYYLQSGRGYFMINIDVQSRGIYWQGRIWMNSAGTDVLFYPDNSTNIQLTLLPSSSTITNGYIALQVSSPSGPGGYPLYYKIVG